MSWDAPMGSGRFVKIGDPAKEGFQKEVEGVYLRRRWNEEYKNWHHDFQTPEEVLTIPGSKVLDDTLTEDLSGKLLRVVYEGQVQTKKGKPLNKFSVYPWKGALPAAYQPLVASVELAALSEAPAALTEESDDLPS